MSENRTLATLTEIGRITVEDLELRPLLQRITDALNRRFPRWDLVALVRIDEETDEFVCEALTTLLPTRVHAGYRREIGSGVVGHVAKTGRALVLDEVVGHELYINTLDGVRSEICVPVRHRGKVVAILNIESMTEGCFRDDVALVEAIADQIAGAIAHARLYEETRKRAQLLEVLSEISRLAVAGEDLAARLAQLTEYVRERFDLAIAAVLVSDQECEIWRHRAVAAKREIGVRPDEPWSVAEGVIGRAIRTGAPQFVEDVARDPDYVATDAQVRSELVVPIRFRERLLGALNLESDEPGAFRTENIALFRMLADQMAGAIELSVLNEHLERTQGDLEASNRELERANSELLRLTRIDGLTGVASRRLFEDRLDEEWRRAHRQNEPLALALFDVDHFKAYNDAYGHQSGDDCLRAVARALADGFRRAGEILARYGGEEFVAVLPHLDLNTATPRIDELRRQVAHLAWPHESSPVAEVVTISAGVAAIRPWVGGEASDLIRAADAALYEAKAKGRNRVETRSAGLISSTG